MVGGSLNTCTVMVHIRRLHFVSHICKLDGVESTEGIKEFLTASKGNDCELLTTALGLYTQKFPDFLPSD